MKKETRLKVFEKFDHHCAYCGCELKYKDMQVDHLIPLRNWDNSKTKEELQDFKNLMPACRKCNHYKRANGLEIFRKMIAEIPKKLERDSYIYKIGVKYGNVIPNEKPIKFYFEEVQNIESLRKDMDLLKSSKKTV